MAYKMIAKKLLLPQNMHNSANETFSVQLKFLIKQHALFSFSVITFISRHVHKSIDVIGLGHKSIVFPNLTTQITPFMRKCLFLDFKMARFRYVIHSFFMNQSLIQQPVHVYCC